MKKYLILALYYASQGAAFALIGKAGLFRLTTEGRTLVEVGIFTAFVLSAWFLKPAYGWVQDRWGRKAQWIYTSGVGLVFSLILFAFAPQEDSVEGFLLLGSFVNFFIAFQDAGIDGLAAGVLKSKKAQGLGQGLMWAGRAVGVYVGGGLMILLSDVLTWSQRCQLIAAFVLLIGLAVPYLLGSWTLEDEVQDPEEEDEIKPLEMSRWDFILCLVTAAAYLPAAAFTWPILYKAMELVGFSKDGEIFWIEFLAPWVAVLAAAVIAPLLVARLSRRRGLLMAAALLAVSYGSIGIWGFDRHSVFFIGILAAEAADAIWKVSLFSFFSEVARGSKRRSGTFASFMAATNLSAMWGKGFGIWIAGNSGYAAAFVAGAMMQLLVVIPALIADRSRERRIARAKMRARNKHMRSPDRRKAARKAARLARRVNR